MTPRLCHPFLPLLLLLCCPKTSQGLQLVGNAYEDLVLEVRDDLDPTKCDDYVAQAEVSKRSYIT